MIAIAIIIGVVLLLIIYLLLIPIACDVAYNIQNRRFKRLTVIIYPLLFSYNAKIEKNLITDKKISEVSAQETKKTTISIKPPSNKSANGWRYNLLLEFDLVVEIVKLSFRLLKGILQAPSYRLNISLTGGLSEPDITGSLYGGVCAVSPLLGRFIRLNYLPDFAAQSLGGDITGQAIVRPYKLIKELLLFGWRLPKLRLIKVYLRGRKGGKHG